MKREILVICPENPDWGLVSKAAELAGKHQRTVRVLTFSKVAAEAAFSYGADRADALYLPDNFGDDYALAAWMREKIEVEWKPDIILAPATIRCRAVMPILAGMLDAGLTADCTEISVDEEGNLMQIRPAFGNNLMAWIQQNNECIQMATVRPGIYRAQERKKQVGELRIHRLELHQRVRRCSFIPFEETCPLNQAEIILAGGMGIGSKENFAFLSEIAKKAGAAVGASRMAVDAGFAPYSCQIGQTGVTVHPKLYIAVGISGAVQHLAGMSGSDTIIAINSDAKAPIFDYADYGIVGDWKEILPQLLEQIG